MTSTALAVSVTSTALAVSVTSFRRYVWTEFPDAADASRVTVPRPDVPAGEEAQVDYGFVGSWQDPATGRVRRVWGVHHGAGVLAATRRPSRDRRTLTNDCCPGTIST